MHIILTAVVVLEAHLDVTLRVEKKEEYEQSYEKGNKNILFHTAFSLRTYLVAPVLRPAVPDNPVVAILGFEIK